jgi:hypothetical protein
VESLEDDEALSGGPYLLVAMPENFSDLFPLNCTALVNEWALHLNPISEIATWAPHLAPESWVIEDRFVVADELVVGLLREAARDHRVVEAFGREVQMRLGGPEVEHPRGQRRLGGKLTREESDGTVLHGQRSRSCSGWPSTLPSLRRGGRRGERSPSASAATPFPS